MVWEQTIFYAREKSGKGTVLIGNSKKSFFKQVTFKLRNEGVGVRFAWGRQRHVSGKEEHLGNLRGSRKQAP